MRNDLRYVWSMRPQQEVGDTAYTWIEYICFLPVLAIILVIVVTGIYLGKSVIHPIPAVVVGVVLGIILTYFIQGWVLKRPVWRYILRKLLILFLLAVVTCWICWLMTTPEMPEVPSPKETITKPLMVHGGSSEESYRGQEA